ncbi:MAG: chromate transporter [Gammaproteobacteria bacterium]
MGSAIEGFKKAMIHFRSSIQVFLVFLKLGFTAFGGPVAHIAFFREEFVVRKRWMTESDYAEIVALCQFLPGPASSQVGLTIGLSRAGYLGSLAAWLGFTMPSATLLLFLALGYSNYGDIISSGLLAGLKIVTVAVVAQAVWGMSKSICIDNTRITIMLLSTVGLLLFQSIYTPLAVITLAGILGVWLFKPTLEMTESRLAFSISRFSGALWFFVFILFLFGLPIIQLFVDQPIVDVVSAFFRSGSLVFGGGHVVLPLLEAEMVKTGWVTKDAFLAGYGATQAVPGPLFTFSAFLGGILNGPISGFLGALVALFSIFLPSFLLVYSVLPFWKRLRVKPRIRAALAGINASVVGILFAALYQPVFVGGVSATNDFIGVIIAFGALMYWKLPPWLVVIAGGTIGALLL